MSVSDSFWMHSNTEFRLTPDLAYGLDRLVMLMAKEDSIRDVIAFPKVKDASCLMTEAPSPVDAAQLEELGLEASSRRQKKRQQKSKENFVIYRTDNFAEVQRCLSFFRFHSIGVKENLRNSSPSSPLFCWKKCYNMVCKKDTETSTAKWNT